jgi:drug/metabolite transporter (DMT)-like permease
LTGDRGRAIGSPKARHTGLGIGAILLWSTTVAFGRSLTEQLGALTSASLIYLLGGTLGYGYQVVTRKTWNVARSSGLRYLLGCGSLFVLYQACLYTALGLAQDRSQVLQVGLMNYLWPMLTLAFSVWILRLRARMLFLVPGAIVATMGVLLAMTQHQLLSWGSLWGNVRCNGLPYLLGGTAAVSWALYSVLNRKWARDAQEGTVPLFMLATGILLGGMRLLFPERTAWTGNAAFEFLFLAIGSNLAYVLWEGAMRKGDIVLVASCSYFTPLLSTLFSSLYLRTVAGARLWIGCALVIAGALVCKLSVQEQPAPSTFP